jgi:hypothetical protein
VPEALSFLWDLQAKYRADERARTADLPSLRVIIHALQGFARARKSRISKLVSCLCLTLYCTVLRSRWCQSGINRGIALSLSSSLAHPSAVPPASHKAAIFQLTLDRYSHWMPSMGRNTAEGMDEELGQATYSCPSLPLGAGSDLSHSDT